jgi:predicted methyltransferase
MRKTLMSTLGLAAFVAAACQAMPATEPVPTASSAHIVAAVADAARPAVDTARDADRKPAEMIVFGEVSPGDKVGELIPGGGYMTRILSKAVGATDKVYVFAGAPVQREGQPPPAAPIAAITADAANYGNVQVILTNFATIPAPYHDMHNPGRNLDINAANKAILGALKPGGLYVVLDHQSAKGVDFDAQKHRIDMAKVKAEVLAAGFEFVAESQLLDNPADDGSKGVFDPAIRGKTDQFILKFRKPA